MNPPDGKSVGQRLFRAAERGDVDGVESALRLGESLGFLRGVVNYRNPRDHTPLVIAAVNNHTEVVSVLLGCAGVDVNAGDSLGCTALIYATMNDNTAVISKLLERPDLNAALTTKYNTTALHSAAKGRRNMDALPLMLRRTKIDVNARSLYGDTAFHYTCNYNPFAQNAILLLRVPGIDVNVENNSGRTALHDALGVGFYPLVPLLGIHHTAVRRAHNASQDFSSYGCNGNDSRRGGRGRRGVWVRQRRRLWC